MRGPIGGCFTWRARDGGPLLLIAGGSGLVPRRVDAEMLRAVGPAPTRRPRIFVCGPTAFVERAADLLITLGHEPATIRTERFGQQEDEIDDASRWLIPRIDRAIVVRCCNTPELQFTW
jgi:ferredoxin-NADP reductase